MYVYVFLNMLKFIELTLLCCNKLTDYEYFTLTLSFRNVKWNAITTFCFVLWKTCALPAVIKNHWPNFYRISCYQVLQLQLFYVYWVIRIFMVVSTLLLKLLEIWNEISTARREIPYKKHVKKYAQS